MNRVVVITGGGTGVGAACARLLAAQGDQVFIIGRRPEPLAALAQEIGAQALVATPPAARAGPTRCCRPFCATPGASTA